MTKARDLASRSGLTQIIPTSITVGGGSASVSANGTITFTATPDFSINNCFSSLYDNYRIMINAIGVGVPAGTTVNMLMRLMANGVPDAANYTSVSRTIHAGQANTSFLQGTTTSTEIMMGTVASALGRGFSVLDIASPFLTRNTSLTGSNSSDSTGNFMSYAIFAATNFLNTAQDGLRVFPSSQTMTGNMRIYGYNNG